MAKVEPIFNFGRALTDAQKARVFDLKPYLQAVYSAEQRVRDAQTDVEAEKKRFLVQVAKHVGCAPSDLLVSNVACVSGMSCIFDKRTRARPCVFCAQQEDDD